TVSALNSVGVGPPSDPATVIPECAPSAPGVPFDVIGSPLCDGAEVDWNAPLADGRSPITGYVVWVRHAGPLIATDLVNGHTFTDAISGLTDGTTYDVTVAGVNENGVGPESESVQIVPDCPPAEPTAPLEVSAAPLCSALEVDWNPPAN